MYEIEELLKNNNDVSIINRKTDKEIIYNKYHTIYLVYSFTHEHIFIETPHLEEAIKELLKNDLKSIG